MVGSGLVLLPWTVFTLISGDLGRVASDLPVLYVVSSSSCARSWKQKIVGDRVGLHPLVTLLSMVIGVYLFGGIGLLGQPRSTVARSTR